MNYSNLSAVALVFFSFFTVSNASLPGICFTPEVEKKQYKFTDGLQRGLSGFTSELNDIGTEINKFQYSDPSDRDVRYRARKFKKRLEQTHCEYRSITSDHRMRLPAKEDEAVCKFMRFYREKVQGRIDSIPKNVAALNTLRKDEKDMINHAVEGMFKLRARRNRIVRRLPDKSRTIAFGAITKNKKMKKRRVIIHGK